jgi:hypothetical protein
MPVPDAPPREEQIVPQEVAAERESLVTQATAITIVDQGSYDMATEMLRTAASFEKKVEEYFEPLRLTAKAAYDAVLTAKKRELEPIQQAKALLSRRVAGFAVEQERLRREAQRKLEEDARKKEEESRRLELEQAKKQGATKKELKAIADAPIEVTAPAVEPTYEKAKGVTKPIERWSAEVIDFMTLVRAVAKGEQPESVLLPNQQALDGMARSLKGVMSVPGVKAVCDYTVSARKGN